MKVVIFCGGFGTRMWPVSRKSYPKQFYPMIGRRSFFQITYKRFRKEFKPSDIFISTEARYIHFVRKQAPEIPIENIIAEPERKDNLAAVGLVTAIIDKRFPGEVMLAAWSDHVITDEKKFLEAVKVAGDYAKETGMIVSINERPKYPATQNEWVRLGETIDEVKGFRMVKILETIKRPELKVAKKMFMSDSYVLNTGYRAWRCDVMLSYFKEYQPDMYKGLIKISDSFGKRLWKTELYREYHKFIKDSIEFGLFVKLPEDKSVTIPADFGWKDTGTWDFFYQTFANGQGSNVIEGSEAEFMDSDRNLIIGPDGKMIAVIGLSDIAVIDTTDGLLVCSLSSTSKVKDLFGILEKRESKYVD